MVENEELDLKEILQAFWNRKWIIVVLMIFGIIFGFVYTEYLLVPKYRSDVTLILSKPVSSSADSQYMDNSITQSDITLNQKLISTYGEIMKSRKVVEQVIQNLNMDVTYEYLVKCVSTTAVDNTDVVKVSVTTENADMSANVVNNLVDVFSGEVERIYNIQNVSIIDEGKVNDKPINVSLSKNIIVFGMVFFVFGAIIVFLLYYFDNTVKSKEEIEKSLGIPVLAVIPKLGAQKEDNKNEATKRRKHSNNIRRA